MVNYKNKGIESGNMYIDWNCKIFVLCFVFYHLLIWILSVLRFPFSIFLLFFILMGITFRDDSDQIVRNWSFTSTNNRKIKQRNFVFKSRQRKSEKTNSSLWLVIHYIGFLLFRKFYSMWAWNINDLDI